MNRWVSVGHRRGSVAARRTGGWQGLRKLSEAGELPLRDLLDNDPDIDMTPDACTPVPTWGSAIADDDFETSAELGEVLL